jgi:hypothetical protein
MLMTQLLDRLALGIVLVLASFVCCSGEGRDLRNSGRVSNSSGPVVLCGGGHAVHVLASLVSQARETRILNVRPDGERKWKQALESSKSVHCFNSEGSDIVGSVTMVRFD